MLLPSFIFALKYIGTVVHAMLPWRVTLSSLLAVSDADAALSGRFLWTPEFVFLPALVGGRRQVVEDQPIVLCIEFRGIRGVPGTPRGAIVLNQLAKRRRVAGFLLSTRSGKG